MTPLERILSRRIAATGPMTLADYMAECLLHPEHGYYVKQDPLGAAGDFTTAPEISQMFGELVGLALAQAWLDQGAPSPVTLAELGPGRGTLMADLLRATAGVGKFSRAARVHLVERSPRLRAEQAKRLGPGVGWSDDLSGVPDDAPLLLVANEFFDALPIRQFQRDREGWREVMVTVRKTRLALSLAPNAPLALLDHRRADTSPPEVVEHCPALPPIVTQIARRLKARGGCACLIDYGGWRSRGDTLQAVRDHVSVPVLDRPGDSDLTAHVDFEPIARAAEAEGVEAWGPVGQGKWLAELGIAARAERLAEALAAAGPSNADAFNSHVAAFQRLTAPDQMGTVFKVMMLVPSGAPRPPGFETWTPGARM